MQMFCGVPTTQQSLLNVARTLNAPILVSANAFWKNGAFRGYLPLTDMEVPLALDCGGFVSMRKYGGYRWTVGDYLEFAVTLRPVWWTSMDWCCEKEVAADRQEVRNRIRKTVVTLAETLAAVITWNQNLPGLAATAPMPVIQGWHPHDYLYCTELMQKFVLNDPYCALALNQSPGQAEWPALVGVGSVCRRPIHGRDGLMRVIETLEAALPHHVQFHLFGVKSQAIKLLKDRPRIASADSMAWNQAIRWQSFKTRTPKTREMISSGMSNWVLKQQKISKPSEQFAML